MGKIKKTRILSEIAEVQVGYQARGRIDESLNGDFCIIRSQDVNERGDLEIKGLLRFFPDSSIDPEKYLVRKDNILIKARGLDHRTISIDQVLEKTVAANSFYIIKIKNMERVLPQYLVWWLNQSPAQMYFEKEQGLSTIPFITTRALLNTPIQIPSINIQKKISEINLLFRKEQELLNQLMIKKEELIHITSRQAVMHSMEEK